jgi:cadmium resistance transport/sequestration family protein
MNVLSAMTTGIISFIATNIDDLFILTALFAQEDSASRRRHIVVGQFLGMSAIITLSIVGAFGALIVPKEWIGLLGVVPVYMGVKTFYARDGAMEHRAKMVLLNPYTYKVAIISIANAGDNLPIYIPIFAHKTLGYKFVIAVSFLFFTCMWCYVAYIMVWNPLVGKWLKKHGHGVIPFILIGLGGYILWDNHTFGLLSKLLDAISQ